MEPNKEQPSANAGMKKVTPPADGLKSQEQQAQQEGISRLRGGGCCAWLACGCCAWGCWECCIDDD